MTFLDPCHFKSYRGTCPVKYLVVLDNPTGLSSSLVQYIGFKIKVLFSWCCFIQVINSLAISFQKIVQFLFQEKPKEGGESIELNHILLLNSVI